jgi:hypothetical protein
MICYLFFRAATNWRDGAEHGHKLDVFKLFYFQPNSALYGSQSQAGEIQ